MTYKNYKCKLLIGLLSITLLSTGCSSKDNVNNNLENTSKQEQSVETNSTSASNANTDSATTENIIKGEIPSSSNVEITFLDTGNSDAILIKENNKAMLIDAGDRDDDSLLTKQLSERGIKELEYFIVTHPHADHCGAADSVLRNFKVNNLFVSNGSAETQVYRDFIEAAANKGVNPSVPLEGSKFYLDNSYFTVLNTNGGPDTNNYSLVVQLFNGEDVALFMGDAEKEVEEKLLNQVSTVGLLKAGHHGSHSSSTQKFIDKVTNDDTIVAIQVGSNNKYGHPHKETMNLFESKGLEVHRNDTCGSIDIISTGSGFTTDCKKGGYESGNKGSGSSDTSDKTNDSYNHTTSNTNSSKPSEGASVNTQPQENSTIETNSQGGTVYYTTNGKSYHTTKGCPTLSRSKKILSGTISSSGKNDPCDRCH